MTHPRTPAETPMRLAVWFAAVAVPVAGEAAPAQDRKPDVVARLEGHKGGVSALAFSPKVSLLATGAGNGVVRLWEAKTGDLLARLDPQKSSGGRIAHLGFSADGNLVGASSRNAVVVWDLTPPPKRDPKDPKDPKDAKKEPEGPRPIPVVFEDGLGTDANKFGVVAGDGRRVWLSGTEGSRIAVGSRALPNRGAADTTDELRGGFVPLAVDAVADPDSGLVAVYGYTRGGEKAEPAVAFLGLGDARVVGRGAVRGPVAGRQPSVGFAPDGKFLVACNGEDLMYWRVPGSQVVEGDPKVLAGSVAFAAAAGPNGRVAFASPPEDGRKVKVTVADLAAATPRVLAVYATDIDRVSALAFSPDGNLLAVADDPEGVVQLWSLAEKK
ncbi:MAG: hypothetical protein C0501_06730 [Isosphaera sp.]|nr:hypothetical protein [Isosphaera sp.]